MRIDLTVHGIDGTSHDVAVTGAPDTAFPEVLAALRAELGAACGADGWWSGARPLDAAARLGGPGLRAGAQLRPHAIAGEPVGRRVHVIAGPDSGRCVRLSAGRLVAGRAEDCGLPLSDSGISRRHVEIAAVPGGITVRDLGSTNGTAVGERPVGAQPSPWPAGEILRIGCTRLALGGPDGGRPPTRPRTDGTVAVTPLRRPRAADPVAIALAARVTAWRAPVPWIAAAVPALVGIALALALGSAQFLLMAVLSPVAVLATALGDRIAARRRVRRAPADDAAERLEAALREETERRRAAHPDAVTLLRVARGPTGRLWERAAADVDMLVVRVGLGTVPSTTTIGPPGEPAPAAKLRDVPVTVDLRAGDLGIVGPPELTDAVARSIVVQLAVLTSPVDVAMDLPGRDEWSWARWLPHVHRGELPAAGVTVRVGTGGDSACADAGAVAVIRLAEHRDDLGARCAHVLEVVDASGRIRLDGDASADAIAEPVPEELAELIARALAPLIDGRHPASNGRSAHAGGTLGELLGELTASAIARRWAAAGAGARTPVGTGAAGAAVIDLARDGPHALIGGTTGSGKSCLLRTLLLGLAASHPPDDVAFLLVDYKGGAAFGDCAGLPHVTGLVTDLDDALTRRALQSLHAEIRRRERAFADAGAEDLEQYRSVDGRAPIPRLVVVVDEFATLASDLPDFVAGLTAVARRGRALGLHLVLATQRPAGAVTAEIRANCSLRIALRMTDEADSRDVVGIPDAAALPAERPGRAVVWSAGALSTMQVAQPLPAPRRHTDREAACRVQRLLPRRRLPFASDGQRGPGQAGARETPDTATELVHAICAAAELRSAAPPAPAWCPPLPERVSTAEFTPTSEPRRLVVGLADLPAQQSQRPLVLDLGDVPTLLIVGAPRSGRTTALQTIAWAGARQLPPDRLHVHAIDLAGALIGRLAGLEHAGTLVGPDDGVPLAADLVAELRRPPPAGRHRLLLVDDWPRFEQAAYAWDGGRAVDATLALMREAQTARTTVAIAGDRSTLTARVMSAADTRVVLRMPDRADYALAGLAGSLPADAPAGRALVGADGVEVQFAIPAPLRPGALPHDAASPPLAPADRPLRLRALPRLVGLSALAGSGVPLSFALAAPHWRAVGFRLDVGAGRMIIAGPPRSGRSTALQTLLVRARAGGLRVAVVAPGRSPLAAAATPDEFLPETAQAVASDRVLVLVDDAETIVDTPLEAALLDWLKTLGPGRAMVAAARTDDLLSSYRGLAAEVRRSRIGLLLRPRSGDGEVLGIRVARDAGGDPPGRGLLVGDPAWGGAYLDGTPLVVQVAVPTLSPCADTGDRSAA